MHSALITILLQLISCSQSFSPTIVRPAQGRNAQIQQTILHATQLLEFREPTTNVKVKLVGAMHYNPTSIQLAEETIDRLGRDGDLGSVIIESCDIRWETTTDMHPVLKKILKSEMRGACDTAIAYNRPVVLGDQRINVTAAKLKTGIQETLVDLASPLSGGWPRLYANVTQAAANALPTGDRYLNPNAFFDPKLMIAAPFSLFKYPLSYFVKSPLPSALVLIALLLADKFGTDTSIPIDEMTVLDWFESLSVVCLEFAIFSRVFVKELLAERNEILAKSILEQCKLYSAIPPKQPKRWWSLLAPPTAIMKEIEVEIVYVAESINGLNSADEKGEKTVVAVLGMAHCNGIMKLLMEEQIS